MLTPVFPLPEKSQKECSLKVGSHDPIFASNYSLAKFFRQQLDV